MHLRGGEVGVGWAGVFEVCVRSLDLQETLRLDSPVLFTLRSF